MTTPLLVMEVLEPQPFGETKNVFFSGRFWGQSSWTNNIMFSLNFILIIHAYFFVLKLQGWVNILCITLSKDRIFYKKNCFWSGFKINQAPHNMWLWVQNHVGCYKFHKIRLILFLRYHGGFFWIRVKCIHSPVLLIVDEKNVDGWKNWLKNVGCRV